MNAERSARQVARACEQGRAEVVLSVPARFAVKFEAPFPGLTSDLLASANKMLPSADESETQPKTGKKSFSQVSPSWVPH